MLDCKRAAELMSLRMDKELTSAQKLSLRLHLMLCMGCRNLARQLDFMRQGLRNYPHQDE